MTGCVCSSAPVSSHGRYRSSILRYRRARWRSSSHIDRRYDVTHEIERKFLVEDRRIVEGLEGEHIVQGYLATGKTSVRVRIAGERAWLTIKGPSAGNVRAEFEYPIPLADANALLAHCVVPPIDKVRYRITHADHEWEVDVFEGENAPLVVAEVELDAPDEHVQMPPWVGREVTEDSR